MNKETIEGRWNEVKGQIKNKWGKLTDDDMMRAEGKFDELVGALQRRYGYEKEEAKRHLESFTDNAKTKVNQSRV